jgi:hypothetical protein
MPEVLLRPRYMPEWSFPRRWETGMAAARGVMTSRSGFFVPMDRISQTFRPSSWVATIFSKRRKVPGSFPSIMSTSTSTRPPQSIPPEATSWAVREKVRQTGWVLWRTSGATARTCASRSPPPTVPILAPSSFTAMEAPASRGPDPDRATTVARTSRCRRARQSRMYR